MLDDAASSILKNLQGEAALELAPEDRKFIGKLHKEDRLRVVGMLDLEGFSTGKIAEIVGVRRETVWKDKQVISKRSGAAITDMDVKELAGGLMRRTMFQVARLNRDKRYRDANTVELRTLSMLQSMGFVLKVAAELNVNLREYDGLSNGDLQREYDEFIEASFNAERVATAESPEGIPEGDGDSTGDIT